MSWTAKPGVALEALRPELARLEPIVCAVCAEWGVPAVVTCTTGDHAGRMSYHNPPFCAALDLRVKHVGQAKMQTAFHAVLKGRILETYPDLYDVLLERRAVLVCQACGKRWAGTPEVMTSIRAAHLQGHPECRPELTDTSHIHIECSPLLALTLFGSSHIATDYERTGGTVTA
jgi:hypothetical protein